MEREIVSTEDLSHGYIKPERRGKRPSKEEIEQKLAEEPIELIFPEITASDKKKLEEVRRKLAKLPDQEKKAA